MITIDKKQQFAELDMIKVDKKQQFAARYD